MTWIANYASAILVGALLGMGFSISGMILLFLLTNPCGG